MEINLKINMQKLIIKLHIYDEIYKFLFNIDKHKEEISKLLYFPNLYYNKILSYISSKSPKRLEGGTKETTEKRKKFQKTLIDINIK